MEHLPHLDEATTKLARRLAAIVNTLPDQEPELSPGEYAEVVMSALSHMLAYTALDAVLTGEPDSQAFELLVFELRVSIEEHVRDFLKARHAL